MKVPGTHPRACLEILLKCSNYVGTESLDKFPFYKASLKYVVFSNLIVLRCLFSSFFINVYAWFCFRSKASGFNGIPVKSGSSVKMLLFLVKLKNA